MRCPNQKCGRAIPDGSTGHPYCGWGMQPDPETQRQRDYYEEKALEERRREAAAFMAEHGLKTQEDCRKFVREKFTEMRTEQRGFEHWCRHMKQSAVDWIARGESKDDKRLLQRLRDCGVIDDQNKLIPLEERPPRAARIQMERMAVAAELEKRREVLVEQAARQPGQDDEELPLGIARDALEIEFQNGPPA